MNPRDKLDIGVWVPTSVPPEWPTKRKERVSRIVGASLSISLHALLLLCVTWSPRVENQSPTALARSVVIRGFEVPLQLISLTTVSTRTDNVDRLTAKYSLTLPSRALIASTQALLTPITLNWPDPAGQSSAIAGDEQSAVKLAAWAETYDKQMKARIERIWQRPRTPIEESNVDAHSGQTDAFICQVLIEQDERGNVLEVNVSRCNGSVEWQRSLVLAIQQASPLPAPPDTAVFHRMITLTFVAYSYVQGMSEDEYEPLLRSAR